MQLLLITGQLLGQGLGGGTCSKPWYMHTRTRSWQLLQLSRLFTIWPLPNEHFSDLKQFLVIQGCTAIGNLSFQCHSGGRQFAYKHIESVRSFQESIAAVIDENLDNDLLRSEFYSVLIDESTDIGTDHNLVVNMRYVYTGWWGTHPLSLSCISWRYCTRNSRYSAKDLYSKK